MNKDLSYGLNSRTDKSAAPSRKRKGLAGFDSDSSSDDEAPTTGRNATNKAITAEQNALRKRAKTALQEYDYDGEYESFTKNKPPPKKTNEDKSSKYITKLLETSKRRTREQEIIYERKIAKDQALEDEEMQYEGKEKFVTSAYKRKLAEREEWIKEEKEREKKEIEDDVTKKTGGSFLFAGFGRNVLSGAIGRDKDDSKEMSHDVRKQTDEDKVNERFERNDSSTETERWRNTDANRKIDDTYPRNFDQTNQGENYRKYVNSSYGKKDKPEEEVVPPKTRAEILQERAVKIREARARYFQRKGLKLSQ